MSEEIEDPVELNPKAPARPGKAPPRPKTIVPEVEVKVHPYAWMNELGKGERWFKVGLKGHPPLKIAAVVGTQAIERFNQYYGIIGILSVELKHEVQEV